MGQLSMGLLSMGQPSSDQPEPRLMLSDPGRMREQ